MIFRNHYSDLWLNLNITRVRRLLHILWNIGGKFPNNDAHWDKNRKKEDVEIDEFAPKFEAFQFGVVFQLDYQTLLNLASKLKAVKLITNDSYQSLQWTFLKPFSWNSERGKPGNKSESRDLFKT